MGLGRVGFRVFEVCGLRVEKGHSNMDSLNVASGFSCMLLVRVVSYADSGKSRKVSEVLGVSGDIGFRSSAFRGFGYDPTSSGLSWRGWNAAEPNQ